jgi:hypothetical protein
MKNVKSNQLYINIGYLHPTIILHANLDRYNAFETGAKCSM